MLGVLQLSDIHFMYERGSIFNVDRELQDGLLAFLPDLQRRLGAIDLILVTGDVAFSGKSREYETAGGFLHEVRSRLRNPKIPVRVIPGNHDIFRSATDSADQDHLRSGPRVADLDAQARGTMLSKMLQDPTEGPALFAPLEAFNQFAAGFGCSVSHQQPYWDHRADVGDGWVLRLRGMTSVLLSNRHDARDRLVIGGNLQTNAWIKTPGEINVSLCHHPYCWLLDAEELSRRVCRRSHLHVTGHVHRHELKDANVPEHLQLMTGALQPPRDEGAIPRFNGLGFDVTGTAAAPKLKLSLTAVRWDSGVDSFVFDEPECKYRLLDLMPAPEAGVAEPDDPRLDRLRERLADLPRAQQLDAASKIQMSVGHLLSLRPSKRVATVMEHARTTSKLAQLWDEVAERHGNQRGDVNPLKGTGL